MYPPSSSQHVCTASLVLAANIRQYLSIIERDMQRQDVDAERVQKFAAQLQQDATTLANHTRMMSSSSDENM
jgi:hypothetical protein